MTFPVQPDLGALPEWTLADLYAGMDDPAFAADIRRALADARAFAQSWRGRLADLLAAPDAATRLFEAIREYEALDDRMGRLMSYAGLLYAGDTTDPARSKFYGDAQERITDASSDLLFFTLELNRLDDAALAAAAALAPLAQYRPWLEDVRREKPHQLDDRLEQLFHEKSVTGASAWNRLFDETLAALRFDVAGESLPLEATLSKMQDENESLRKAASESIAKTLGENLRVFTLIANTLAKDKEIADRWRGFADVASARHLANRVEPETIDALVEAVQGAYPRLSHRYYKLKAKWFGKPALDHWDRNAPLPQTPARLYAWEDARALVLDAYAGFAPRMADIARDFFDKRWIDAPARPGKAPGAFAHPTVPSAHPYVLLNYLGKPRDVMTLAHELGHGVHQVLAAPNGALMAPTPLTLAETASVFGEMLTFRKLLAQTPAGPQRRALLASKVEDMLNTVVRQIAFYSFERKLHLERRNGELTAQRIGELWMSVQAESLGPSIVLHPGYETYWAYIPHFVHSPFYVYAYAFGDCLVNSLYGLYQKADTPAARDDFVERYFALLAAGGSKPYDALLKPFGLDARDPGFWSLGLGMIEGLIDELEGDGGRRVTAMRETDLYAPVKAFLEAQGYEVKAEIEGCDVVALRGDEPPVVVELKRAVSLKLLLQGVDRQAMTDAVYLAVAPPKRRDLSDVKSLCRRLGLGLLLVGPRAVEAALDPAPYRPRKDARRAGLMLREFQRRVGDPNQGGAARRSPTMTAYRQDALRCLRHLSQNGGEARLALLRAQTGVERAGAILRDDHYGWFARKERGLYALTPKGESALTQFANTLSTL